MARGNQITRQWAILRYLDAHSHGIAVSELVDTLHCTERTVYRDLADLQNAGFPLTIIQKSGKNYWSYVEGFKSNIPIAFSLTEVMSLYLLKDLVSNLEGTFFHESLDNFFIKLKALLTPQVLNFLHLDDSFLTAHLGPSSCYTSFKEALECIQQACQKKRTLHFDYYSRRHERSHRQVDPYKIYYHQGVIYLIGFCHLRKEVRMFVLNRMEKVELTEHNFEKQNFNFKEFLKHSFGVMIEKPLAVRVKILPQIARFIAERQWHPSQKIQTCEDGAMIFSFEVAGIQEIKAWILSLGANAVVLEPGELVGEILAEYHSIKSLY